MAWSSRYAHKDRTADSQRSTLHTPVVYQTGCLDHLPDPFCTFRKKCVLESRRLYPRGPTDHWSRVVITVEKTAHIDYRSYGEAERGPGISTVQIWARIRRRKGMIAVSSIILFGVFSAILVLL